MVRQILCVLFWAAAPLVTLIASLAVGCSSIWPGVVVAALLQLLPLRTLRRLLPRPGSSV